MTDKPFSIAIKLDANFSYPTSQSQAITITIYAFDHENPLTWNLQPGDAVFNNIHDADNYARQSLRRLAEGIVDSQSSLRVQSVTIERIGESAPFGRAIVKDARFVNEFHVFVDGAESTVDLNRSAILAAIDGAKKLLEALE